MSNFIKPNSISFSKANTYISIIGLGPCMLFKLLFEESFESLDEIMNKFGIQEFEIKSHLDTLQAAKLLQVSVVEETLFYQMFQPLNLGQNLDQEKWEIIQNYKITMDRGSNISKTYYDIFHQPLHKTNNQIKEETWVSFYENNLNTKILVSDLIFINQMQVDYNLKNSLINIALNRTFYKCSKFNSKYFELIIKTFKKLEIKTTKQADDFFIGNFFTDKKMASVYLEQLEAELIKLGDDNG